MQWVLIASVNVANLMAAQAAVRAREMALRVSIGAGPWRLMQLVLVESAWLAFLAAAIGALFAWWSAPFVVSRINPPDNPARLFLPADWRVLGFAAALALGVTILFGLAPALRASAVTPASALKGGEDPHARHRVMNALIAVQVAFCSVVLFVAGLFVATFDRLSHQPTGFSSERLLTLDTVARRPQSPVLWDQVAEHLLPEGGMSLVGMVEPHLPAPTSLGSEEHSADLTKFLTLYGDKKFAAVLATRVRSVRKSVINALDTLVLFIKINIKVQLVV